MTNPTPADAFAGILLHQPPAATAWIQGGSSNPDLSGSVRFYQTPYGGILAETQIFNMPNIRTQRSSDFYGIHIHENGDCSNHFNNTGNHYNPSHAEHPQHSGDMPPLLANQGYAYSVFYDKRFTLEEIIGRSVVIHSMRDDFTSQPSGDSGTKIGCGVIRRNR